MTVFGVIKIFWDLNSPPIMHKKLVFNFKFSPLTSHVNQNQQNLDLLQPASFYLNINSNQLSLIPDDNGKIVHSVNFNPADKHHFYFFRFDWFFVLSCNFFANTCHGCGQCMVSIVSNQTQKLWFVLSSQQIENMLDNWQRRCNEEMLIDFQCSRNVLQFF